MGIMHNIHLYWGNKALTAQFAKKKSMHLLLVHFFIEKLLSPAGHAFDGHHEHIVAVGHVFI